MNEATIITAEELAALRLDAGRYRHLRNHPLLQRHGEIDVRQFKFPRATWAQIAFTELDAALDEAIANAAKVTK